MNYAGKFGSVLALAALMDVAAIKSSSRPARGRTMIVPTDHRRAWLAGEFCHPAAGPRRALSLEPRGG